jgi:hypothetical protein
MKHEPIKDAWEARNEFYAAGVKLRDEGFKRCAKGDKLLAKSDERRAEGDKLLAKGDEHRAEGAKLIAEGHKIRVEGNDFYRAAVLAKYGPDAVIDWTTGEIETK